MRREGPSGIHESRTVPASSLTIEDENDANLDDEDSAARSDPTPIQTLPPTKSVGFFPLRVRTIRSHR
jgi:hypothetical protein